MGFVCPALCVLDDVRGALPQVWYTMQAERGVRKGEELLHGKKFLILYRYMHVYVLLLVPI